MKKRRNFSMLLIVIFVGCTYFVNLSHQQSSISLNTAQWFVSNSNSSINVPAQVPGGIYSDLRRNSILKQDILYGKNDVAYRWVGNENWTYTTTFTIDHHLARSQSVKLVLHGVDTIASVHLNGQEIGTTDNMFVRYRFDIKPHLKLVGMPNVLVVKFESPVKYSNRRSRQSIRQNRGKIIPPYCPSPAQRGECHVNFIRKMQASFSWDWGPAFPSMGIYKDIEIEFGSFGIIRDILVETRRFPALYPLASGGRPSTNAPPMIISTSIRQQVRRPTISNNRTVPYVRAPPYYISPDTLNIDQLQRTTPAMMVNPEEAALNQQQLLEENWLLKTTLVAEMVQPSFGYNLRIEFNLNNVLHYESEHINVVANSEGFIRLGFNLRIDPVRMRVKSWWPNNAGAQSLYKLTARMMPIPAAERTGRRMGERSTPNSFVGHVEPVWLQYRNRPPRTPAPEAPASFLASLAQEHSASSAYQLQHVSEKQIHFGFRTVELIQEPVSRNPDEGLSFHFRVNGVDLFAMGSNWIPASVLPEETADEEYLRYLLQSAKDANMNMLRVWGGGLYESDAFYRLADEMGIMIWHDFMFACALYPTDDDFLASVRLEVEQQVQRLQHHPSIVLWAGNNENEMAIAGPWWAEVLAWNKKLRENYSLLYVDTIKPIVQILDPTRPYLESSPSNGLMSAQAPNAIARTPNDNKFGDVHHYDYLADSFDWTNYPSTRFASEYGFQSYPSFGALAQVSAPADWKYPLTNNILHRQHRLTGESEMRLQIKLHFSEPQAGNLDKFKSFIYTSQLTQAIAIKTETEFYRRNRFVDPETKLGRTMGALYWQLNDVWQAPTWSSIELGGKWKMLHYFARRFFFPVMVVPYLVQPGSATSGLLAQLLNSPSSLPGSSGSLELLNSLHSLVSQRQQPQQGFSDPPIQPTFAIDLVRDDLFHLLDSFNVTMRFFRWTSFAPIWQETIYVKNTRPQNVTRIYEQDLARILRNQPGGGISPSSGVFQVLIEQQPALGLSEIDNYLLPLLAPSKITAMRVAKISLELVQGPLQLAELRGESASSSASHWACAYRLTLVSDSIAMFVWLDLNPLALANATVIAEPPPAPGHIRLHLPGPPLAGLPGEPPNQPPEHIRLNIPQRAQRSLDLDGVARDPLLPTHARGLRFQFSDNVFNMFEPSKVVDLYLSRCLVRNHVESALEIQTLADSL